MHPDFFQKQVERLRGVYSPTSLSQERVEVLWQRFKNVPDAQFLNAVNSLIGEFTTQALPGMSRFEEAVSRHRPSQAQAPGEFQREPQYRCSKCRDFGYVWSQENEHLIVHCTCPKHHEISFQELEKQQINYDKGRKLLKKRSDLSGFIGRGA